MENLKWRWLVVGVVFLITVTWLVPNFISDEKLKKTWLPSKDKLVMGLDIQGGLHLVLGVNTDDISETHAGKLLRALKDDESVKDFKITDVTVAKNADNVLAKVTLAENSQADKLNKYIEDYFGNTFQVLNKNTNVVELRFYDTYLRDFKKQLVQRTIETIRNRVDELGVAEPSITAQGDSRILVQLPGLKENEVANAKDIINKTAKLEFMIVEDQDPNIYQQLPGLIEEAEKAQNIKLGQNGIKYGDYVKKLNEALKEKLPKDTTLRFQKIEGAESLAAGKIPYILSTVNQMGGENLTNANPNFGQYGNPIVSFSLSGPGIKQLRDLTTNFQGRRMAIVLDGVVQSAPNLREPIPNGSGQIDMGSSGNRQDVLNEAINLALVLRSGALPAELEQLEERTVGPTLGMDSIQKGKLAGLVGTIIIFLFMLFYYKGYGLIANLALLFNLMIVFAIQTAMGVTLTLPGVAGMALTIGMAVDANIIIYERIKEELAKGASVIASVREGFNRAFTAIFDSNITTVATCMVLMYFGSGPIRGFAVSLLIGLTASMFTAIFVTQTALEQIVGKNKVNMKL